MPDCTNETGAALIASRKVIQDKLAAHFGKYQNHRAFPGLTTAPDLTNFSPADLVELERQLGGRKT